MTLARKWRIAAMIAGIIIAYVVVGGILLPLDTYNGGGNSAALATCGTIPKIFYLVSAEHGNQPISIADMSASEREDFGHRELPDRWGARILVTSAKVGAGAQSATAVIAVCDRPFDNVPRRRIGRAPLAHAVAYATGATGLLSVEEFRRLDLTGFVDVRTIPDAKVEPAGSDQPATRTESKAR